MKLEGKRILITGSGSGLGAEMARTFAAEGATVGVVANTNRAGAEAVAGEIEAAGGRAMVGAADVADERSVAALFSWFVDALGGIDVLVNNAAIVGGPIMGADRDIHEMDVEVWDRTMTVNLRGAMLCTKHALPSMMRQKAGSIVNISNTSSQGLPQWSRPAYATSKAGMNLLTRYTAARYGRDGVRCNAILPGMILTRNVVEGNLSAEAIARIARHQLTPVNGTPADITAVALLLASDDAPFLTGALIPVDGGAHAHFPNWADDYDAAMAQAATDHIANGASSPGKTE